MLSVIIFYVVVLNVTFFIVMLSVIMLNVVILNAVASYFLRSELIPHHNKLACLSLLVISILVYSL